MNTHERLIRLYVVLCGKPPHSKKSKFTVRGIGTQNNKGKSTQEHKKHPAQSAAFSVTNHGAG